MQPSEIEALPFYEIEYTFDNLSDDIKKRNEQEQTENGDMNPKSMMSQSQKSMKQQQSGFGKSINTPKMPSMPKSPSIPRGGMKF